MRDLRNRSSHTCGPAVASAADDARWYATANVGGNFMSDQTESLSGGGATQSGDASLSSGLLTGAAVGRAFSRSFQAEAEFVYQSVDHDGIRLTGGSSLPSGNFASTASACNCSPEHATRSASDAFSMPGFAT